MTDFFPHGVPKILAGDTDPKTTLNNILEDFDASRLRSGLFAARPSLAGETTPGQFYYATDRNQLWFDDGTDWILVLSTYIRVVTAAGTTTLDPQTGGEALVLVDATLGNVTLVLPPTETLRPPLTVKRTDASGNTVAIEPDDPINEEIDGGASLSLTAQHESRTLMASQVADGAWHVIAGYL